MGALLTMRALLTLIWFSVATSLYAQINLTISGRTYTNSADTWPGVNIPRSTKTNLVFTNNTFSSVNRYGYMLQAGDESPGPSNNNLDGAIITGNRFTWRGTDMQVITHGLFTGHNINVIIKYNYLYDVPMGIIRKSGNNMSNTGGGVAYNIVKGGAVGMIVKGISNVNIFNNTFYGDRTPSQTWRPLLYIYTNTDSGRYSVAHGTKVYNNIFYTKHRTFMITIDNEENLTGFECDYNLYWSEAGPPVFTINETEISFEEWQAMGYDQHSVVMNPNFRDLTSFAPRLPLRVGRDLGPQWAEGLSVNARWGIQDPATDIQSGSWQVGAVIIQDGDENPSLLAPQLTQSVIENDSPSIIELTYSRPIANIVPPGTAFTVHVNSLPVTVIQVTVSGTNVQLTLERPVNNDDRVTVAYSRPVENALQGAGGELADSFGRHAVINNIFSGNISDMQIKIYPNPAKNYFNISNIGSERLPQSVRIFDMSGKLRHELYLDTDFLYRVPFDLSPGIYFIHLKLGSVPEHVEKLIVIE